MTTKMRHRVAAFVAAGTAALAALAAGAATALAAPIAGAGGRAAMLGRAGAFRPQYPGAGSALAATGISAAVVGLAIFLTWSLDRRSGRQPEAVAELPAGSSSTASPPADEAADEWAEIGGRRSSGQDQERKAA